MPYPNAYERVKKFLKDHLRAINEQMQTHPEASVSSLFRNFNLTPANAAREFKTQVKAYWRGDYPFKHPFKGDDPLEWWNELAFNPNSRVLGSAFFFSTKIMPYQMDQFLAIRLFSILVNYMPDERTN